MRKIKSR